MPTAIPQTRLLDASGATAPPSTGPLASAGGLGKDDFLKLLVAQLQNQDPLSPVNDQEFMSQMTAFSTLEQVTNLAASSEALSQTIAGNQSISLIGRHVTYAKEDGSTAEGVVEDVSFGEEGVSLTVGGESGVVPGLITEVR